LSNEELNALIDALNEFNGASIPITCAEPETIVGLFDIFTKSIELATMFPTILDDEILPDACERFTCADELINPSGKTPTNEELTIESTDELKLSPEAAAVVNAEPLSICFNRINVAICINMFFYYIPYVDFIAL
jgi:hypothetical protein